MAEIGIDLKRAAALLESGEIVAVPTETVYGLAGNALHAEAVLKIFKVKQRPDFNPLIVHVANLEQAREYVTEFPPQALKLAKAFWPGPLTLLLPRSSIIQDLVTAGSSRVAIRIPRHPQTLALLNHLDFPLAAPSANPFGYISPTSAEHVQAQLGEKIPYILDGGKTTVGVESTIVGFDAEGEVELFRVGGIPKEDLEKITGPIRKAQKTPGQLHAPGRLSSHYAPRTPFVLGEMTELLKSHGSKKIGVLSFKDEVKGLPKAHQIILSKEGRLDEAAHHLFAAMRQLDGMGLDVILAEKLPEQGLGRAINDRLQRAAAD